MALLDPIQPRTRARGTPPGLRAAQTTIVHVGSFGLKPKGAFLHSVARKLSNGFVRNGHNVVTFSDRDVARAGSLVGHRKFGIGSANTALRRLCRDVAPGVLVLGHADVIRPETVAAIRADLPGIRVVQWNVDATFDGDTRARITSKLEVVDATLVSTVGREEIAALRRPGGLLGFLPNPVDVSVERGRSDLAADLPADLFLAVGNPNVPRLVCGRHWRMENLARAILRHLPALRTSFHGIFDHPQIAGASYQTALEEAAMGLNISRRNDVPLYSSDRLAQMIGNGLLVFVDRASGYDRLFGDDAMAFFSSIDEMIKKIGQYAASPAERRAVAAAGRRQYIEMFNERAVARYVVDMALGVVRPQSYSWPTLL